VLRNNTLMGKGGGPDLCHWGEKKKRGGGNPLAVHPRVTPASGKAEKVPSMTLHRCIGGWGRCLILISLRLRQEKRGKVIIPTSQKKEVGK